MNVQTSADSPPGTNTASGVDPTPANGSVTVQASPRFGFPLPFDPVRLLAGVLSRWPWIVIGMLVGGTLGTLVGMRLTHQSFTLSVSLIKRRVPHTVQASETGQAYRPVDLNDATLLATLLATEPLDLALKRANNGVDQNRIRGLVEAKQLEGTDIFYITYHSPLSPKDAVSFSGVWAAEINAYTQRLQRTEASEVHLILQKEVADLEQQLAENNLEILNFSKAKDFLGGEAQVAAALAKLSQIELQLETARTLGSAKTEQLKNFTDQIQRQSPIELQLRTATEELANLRATYTDANPLVQAKLQSIAYLEEQIKALADKGKGDLDAYTGTALGNQLYLAILGLRNEQLEAASQIASLTTLYQTTAARVAEFPAIVSGYNALKTKGGALMEGLSLMSNRLKEAEIFASGAPGYWQVFQAPDPRNISPSSLVKMPAALGVASGLLGAGLTTLLTLLVSQRSSRRSVLECCAATKAPLISHIPATTGDDAQAAIAHFWLTHLAPQLTTHARILFWTPALDPAVERRLWPPPPGMTPASPSGFMTSVLMTSGTVTRPARSSWSGSASLLPPPPRRRLPPPCCVPPRCLKAPPAYSSPRWTTGSPSSPAAKNRSAAPSNSVRSATPICRPATAPSLGPKARKGSSAKPPTSSPACSPNDFPRTPASWPASCPFSCSTSARW